ncbi:CPBP family intramembrane glutamic endopeptidase [Stenotrophomonas rhizophila]|uniref:CPBP family intramembrane glutamic endopeptidase n=1 Tax=Stenotrophomonas rhizophila TaxID=216778 RepID=UPI0010C013D7|nr:CPBP family intramembrane glutamic endopeptidase [Stenotrophomonas rhizophila]TKK06891.1 CPBP family intramembrane metalloprotease [Stenotrophomonas rhizophila]
MHTRPSRPRWLTVSLIVITLVASINLRDIAAWAGWTVPGLPMPFGGAVVDNGLGVLLALAVAAWLLRPGHSLVRAVGLAGRGWQGPAVVLLATLPCWFGLWWLGGVGTDWTWLSLLMLAVLFPLAEEVIFRGVGFIFVYRQLRWPWWPAALLQAAVFGAIHWWSFGGGGGVALQVLAMTSIGGLVFAALCNLDRDTVWSAVVLHVSLNMAWNVMQVSETTAIGWQGNSLRLSAALLAVLGLLALRRWRRRTEYRPA